jgi:hypothetical protein
MSSAVTHWATPAGLLRGVGNLCVGAENNPRYDARRLVGLLIAGLRVRLPNIDRNGNWYCAGRRGWR